MKKPIDLTGLSRFLLNCDNRFSKKKDTYTKSDVDALIGAVVNPDVETSQPVGGFLPNKLYNLGELSGDTTFTLAAGEVGKVNHYYWTFDTQSTAPTITWPTGLSWFNGMPPIINASKHYEISVLNNIAIGMEV